MAAEQQQALLSAHAGAERVDARRVDPQPRHLLPDDRRHPREVVDLAGVTPREAGEAPPLSLGVDDRERAESGQVSPAVGVVVCRNPTPVR